MDSHYSPTGVIVYKLKKERDALEVQIQKHRVYLEKSRVRNGEARKNFNTMQNMGKTLDTRMNVLQSELKASLQRNTQLKNDNNTLREKIQVDKLSKQMEAASLPRPSHSDPHKAPGPAVPSS